ncbi:MAG: efflux RND transporter periplasmic adaptor subunit [Xanthobacteraceae bacterium]
MRRHQAWGWLAAIWFIALPIQSAPGHEGHDHGTPSPSTAPAAAPRAEAASELFELVVAARNGELTIYLDRFATGEPVTDAIVTVETPQGSVEAKPAADGTYRLPAAWSSAPGRYDLIFTVTKSDVADVLTAALNVPPAGAAAGQRSETTGSTGTEQLREHLARLDFGLAGPVIAAFVAGAAGGLWLARRRRASALLAVLGAGLVLATTAVAHEGEDHGDAAVARPVTSVRDVAQIMPDGSVFVPKSTQRILVIRTAVTEPAAHPRTVELPGRIIPDPNASGFVQAALGGRLSPPDGGFPRLGTRVKKGDVLAYLTTPLQAIDISDMRQRQGELDQQISIVERRLKRYETLAPGGSVSRVAVDETRLELQGLNERRASLDKVRREPEALVAPVDGVVADGSPVAGQIAQTNAIVFHIIDPARLWVEALSYEALPNLDRATARVGNKEINLVFRGAGFADRNQSVPIHFAVEGNTAGMRVGQFVTVLAETPEQQQGIAVPRSSIVRSSAGQDVVFEHVSAERFEQRPVRIEPLDGQRVLVVQGLEPGKRVVVQGAELIDHIR